MGIAGTIFASVTAAFIAGITILAKRSPKQYRRLASVLGIAALAAFLGTAVYSIGADRAILAVIEFVEPGKQSVALASAKAIRPDFETALWIFGACVSYIYALTFLPAILGLRDDGSEKDDSQSQE